MSKLRAERAPAPVPFFLAHIGRNQTVGRRSKRCDGTRRRRPHELEGSPLLSIDVGAPTRFGVLQLHRPDLLDRRHRDAGVHLAEDLSLRCCVDAVCQATETFVQLPPEIHPIGNGGRRINRETSEMLVTDLSVYSAGRNDAELDAASGLAGADEHGVVARYIASAETPMGRATTHHAPASARADPSR